ncbi:MAG: glycosyltransferase family 39 protein [Chloroflexota bacterium]
MQRFFAICLVFVSFFLSAHLSRTVFERLPHLEDELAYLYQARIFARGDVAIDTPDPRSPFWQPFVVDYEGNRFSKYTPGWSAILSIGVLLGATWWINAALSALTVALTYRIGEEIFSPDTGLIAAVLVTFSPIFLLLGGSLMGHTAALCSAMLFTYAYWRLEQEKHPVRWGALAGVALGLLVANRPLTAIGVVTPFIVFSLLRLVWVVIRQPEKLWWRLAPLLTLGVVALLFAPAIPAYRNAVAGDPTLNLYTLVWEYDRVGFGEDVGRFGHTLEKGIRHTREDFTLFAADLFGWQFGGLTFEQRQHLLIGTREYPGTGYSWVLIPLGVLAGLIMHAPRRRWTLMLLAIPVSVIAVHLAYWIGSQRYSTRYYFEGMAAAALVTAILPGWLAARSRIARAGVYVALVLFTGYFAVTYTFPRIRLLHSYNHVTQARIDEINAMRQTDKPVVVILSGDDMTWRSNGTLMGVTGPYLDTDIVLARDRTDGRYRDDIIAMFPDREIIELNGKRSKSWLRIDAPDSNQMAQSTE